MVRGKSKPRYTTKQVGKQWCIYDEVLGRAVAWANAGNGATIPPLLLAYMKDGVDNTLTTQDDVG